MTVRHRPSLARVTLAKLAVSGVAGLTSALVVAPAAIAAAPGGGAAPGTTDTTQTTGSDQTAEDLANGGEQLADDAATEDDGAGNEPTDPIPPADGAESTGPNPLVPEEKQPAEEKVSKVEVADVEPDFGAQKYRVGVQIADGSYVPAGTTTAGTKFTITETGPNVEGGTRTFTCSTDASTQEPSGTSTFCLDSSDGPTLAMRRLAKAAAVELDPEDFGADDQTFFAAPGSTITITQTSAAGGLVRDPAVTTIQPCSPSGFLGYCPGNGDFGSKQTKVLYSNPGLPPTAADDSATTREGEAVTIGMLKNDDTVNGAPITGLTVVSGPSHGKARIDGNKVTYTPRSGFTGTDRFDYRLSTPNGAATATVTVKVLAAATAPAVGETDTLPDTGGVDTSLLGYGALMIAGGGLLTARGRRLLHGTDVLTD